MIATKLDMEAVRYLINIANELGFDVLSLDSSESASRPPVITIRFRQLVERVVASAPAQKEDAATPSAADVLRGKAMETLEDE
jgi:hypothetical protein